MEFPDGESKRLRVYAGAHAKPRFRAETIPALTALEQRRHVRRRLQVRHAGEVADLADEHRDDQNGIRRVGAEYAAPCVAWSGDSRRDARGGLRHQT